MLGPCSQCDYTLGVWNGRREWLFCPNYPGHEGQLSHVSGTGIVVDCHKFSPRRQFTLPGAGEAVRYISLGDGSFAIVDAADYEWLSQYTWRPAGGGYTRARVHGKRVLMHRLIMNPHGGKVVDHLNGNRRDNRRSNLRECTHGENNRNTRKYRGTSRFKGVSWCPSRHKWQARIYHNGRTIKLGWFDDEIEAAQAYDRAAIEWFGAFACLNFPSPGRGRLRVRKSEIPNPKSETSSNHQNPKPKTEPRKVRVFRSLSHLNFDHCFVFRISDFEFPQSPPWPTGPPEDPTRSLTTSYRFAARRRGEACLALSDIFLAGPHGQR
jgi:hypothetical protein